VECDAESGTILTARPTALVFSADGVTPTPVDEFQAFVPVNTGALDVRYPTSGYQGTAYTALGIERTKTITCLDWKDSSNSLNMTLFASEYLATVQDIVYEGSLPYFGLLANALLIGQKLNITGSTYPTGWDSFAIPIIAVELEYRERSGATSYLTTLSISNRRAPFSGAALKRPAVLGQPFGIGLTGLPSAPQPTGPSAAGQGSPAGADQDGATDSNSGDSPAPVAALGCGPAPSDPIAESVLDGSPASLSDSLLGQTDGASASPSGGATPSRKSGLAEEPADDEGQQRRRPSFVYGRTSQFARKPPSFRPRVADAFAPSHSRPDVDSVAASGADAQLAALRHQDHGTKATQANPATSYGEGAPNDQRADKVSETSNSAIGGLAEKAAHLRTDSDARPGRLSKVPHTPSGLETSSKAESFSGIDEDDTDFAGPGTFTKNDFDSTIHTDNDRDDTATDASAKRHGMETSYDHEFHGWSGGRQDVDSVRASGADTEPVTLTDPDDGSKTAQADRTTVYGEETSNDRRKIRDALVGPTLVGPESNANSSFVQLTEDDSVDTMTSNDPPERVVAESRSGAPVTSTSGSQTPEFIQASHASLRQGDPTQAEDRQTTETTGGFMSVSPEAFPDTSQQDGILLAQAQTGNVRRGQLQNPPPPAPPVVAPKPGTESEYDLGLAGEAQALRAQMLQSLRQFGLSDAPAQTEVAVKGAQISKIWASVEAGPLAQQLVVTGPGGRTGHPGKEDVQNAIQHGRWLATMYLWYGETKANEIAWIHEQYGSDGWADTLRDFYNNNQGVKIGKQIEQILGPDAITCLRSGGRIDSGKFGPPRNSLQPSAGLDWVVAQVDKLAKQKAIEAAKSGSLVLIKTGVVTDPAKNQEVIDNERRFWDADVFYIPHPPLQKFDRKPPVRP
jgi:hypothetical protein